MSNHSAPSLDPIVPRKAIYVAVVVWVLMVITGFVVVERFAADETERDQQHWQRTLQLTVQSQRRGLEQWIATEQSVIDGLAGNTSLKLYMTELEGAGGVADQAFTSFLSHLLISEAQQHGFTEPRATDALPANVPVPTGSGVAILGNNKMPMVSTSGTPTLGELPAEIRQAFDQEHASPIGPFLLPNGKPYLLFYAPVPAIQSDKVQGHIMGVKVVGEQIQELLKLPPQASATSESLLVRMVGKQVQYISGLADGTAPLTLALDLNTDDLAAAYVTQHPGQFAKKRDYLGTQVLVVGQPVSGTDWTLMHKINKDVAFAESRARMRAWLVSYVLLAGLITAALVAAWRSISASRARQAAMHYQQLTDAAQKQKSLLTHLTNTLIMLVDSRDPHAQHHSNGVALIASAIAEQMALTSDMQETTTLAASLMNVGKIHVPQDLLAQKDISDADKDEIRKNILASADALKAITFHGPVVDTLKQALEHVDGSGPLGLKEEDILLPAKIIAVANAFVAMISERAYRKAMSIDTALDEIHASVDKIYARPVVAALEHYLENGGGRETWERITKARS